MPRNPVRQSKESASPLMEFASFLDAARGKEGTIALPKNVLRAVKDSRPTKEEVTTIVHAIEPADPLLCKRLDSLSLVVLCKILSSSEPCLAQQRGLCLIAEALYHDQTDSAAKKSKKSLVGQHALNALIKAFIDSENPEQNRRWMGILALELLEGCAENATRLQSNLVKLRALSEVVKHGRCQVLKLVAGSMIRILLNCGVSPEDLWPTEADRNLFSYFPRSQHHDTTWIIAFEGFVDELVLGHVVTQERTDVLFAHALSVGGVRYNAEDESAILVTVAGELRIVISSSPTEPAKYIDLPLECIQQVTLQSRLNTQSQTSSYAVIIHLAAATEHTYYLNAVGHNDDAILLAFTSEIYATTIKNIVLPSQRHPAEIRMSQQPIDCSRPVSNGESAGTDPASTSDQDLRETSSQAASSRARHPPSATVAPATSKLTSVSRVKTTQLNVSETNLRPEDENMEWAAVVISNAMEDIPVCLHLNTGNAQAGTGVQQPAISPADIASMRPTTQHSVLDDREQIPQDENQGYDSSYDVSPRVPKAAPKESKSKIPPVSTSIQTSELHNEAGDGTTNNAPLSKLSRSLQNGDGKLDIGIEPPSSSDFETTAGRDAKTSTNSKGPKSGKAKAPAKGKGRTQKKQPLKKAVASKAKGKALADNEGEERDEFDLPESPERSKAKSMASGVPHEIAQAPSQAMGKTRKTNVSNKESLNAPLLASRTVSSVRRHATSKPPVRPAKPRKADETKDESIWNFGSDTSDEDHDIDPKQGAKTKAKAKAKVIKKQPPKVSKVEKPEKPQSKAKKSGTREYAKLPPATLNEPRSRRAAADKANEKILRIEEFDEIVDDDEEGPVAKPQKKSAAAAVTQPATATQAQKSKSYINDRAPSIATKSEAGKITATKFIAPVENAKVTSQVESGSDIEDAEEVDLVADITRQATEKTGAIPVPPSTAIGADSFGFEVTSPEQGDAGTNEAMIPTGCKDTETSPNEPQPTLKPDKPKEIPSSKSKVKGKAVAKIDHTDDQQSVKSIKPILEPRQPKIKAHSSKPRDPFGAKLDFLAQETEQINSEVQKPAGFQVADISKTTKQFKVTAPQAIQVEAAKKTEHADKIRHVQAKVEDRAKNVKAPRKINDQAVAENVVNREAQTLQEKIHGVRNHGKPNRKTENGNLIPHQEMSKEDTKVLPCPAIGNKRKISQDGLAEQKKPKLAPVKKDIKRVEKRDNKVQKIKRDVKAKHEEAEPEMDEDQGMPIPEFSRKPEIISFSASGPRNQGIASKKKPKRSKHSKMADRFSKEMRRTLERENAPYADDPAPWEQEQRAKRHKRGITPPAAHKHVPQTIPEPKPMAIQDRPHRLSSQSTRVNENGSPIPIANPRNESSTAQKRYLKDDNVRDAIQNAQLDDDDQFIIQSDRYNRDEVALPPVRKSPILGRDNMGFVGLPNNDKQVPSSPYTPSAFASMPAHHVYQDGKIVNPKTTEKIIPTKLHDPFVGGRRGQTSSFIETLRNLSNLGVQRLRNGPKEQKPATKLTRHSLSYNDDPDKTLVEPEPVRKRKYETLSTSSSSSESVTPKDTSPSQAVTPYQSDAETLAQRRKAYEPHQGNMFDVLSNITHRLMKHLVDEETVIKDILKDYTTGGSHLINEYKKSRQEILESNNANLDQLRHQLRTAFGKAQAGLAKTSKEMRKKRTSDLERQWAIEQQGLLGTVKAAVAGCAE